MIGISFVRVLKSASKNFWRNIWLSAATMVIMVITLLMTSFLYFANVFGAEVLRTIEQKVDLSVTFRDNTSDEFVTALTAELESRADIESISIISSEQALEIFRQNNSDDPLIEESLQEIDGNPLPVTMYVLATEPRFYQNIAAYLENDKYDAFIEKVNFEDTRAIIDRLISLISSIKSIGLVLTVLFAVLVVLIMFNTVRLAIYSFREEIDIMRLVGASRWFIQGPFIIEGIFVAIASTVISSAVIYPTLKAVSPHLQSFFFDAQGRQFDLYQFAVANLFTVIGLQVVLSITLASSSSYIAIRRYLRLG